MALLLFINLFWPILACSCWQTSVFDINESGHQTKWSCHLWAETGTHDRIINRSEQAIQQHDASLANNSHGKSCEKKTKFSSTNPGGRFKLLLRLQRRSTETKAAGCLKQSHPLHRIACKNVLIHLTNLKDCQSHKKNTLSLCSAATTTATSNSPFPQRHFLHPQFSAGTGHPLWEFLLSILSDIITMMLIHCWDDVT